MSDASDVPEPDDDEAVLHQNKLRADSDRLFELIPTLDDDLRKIGLYFTGGCQPVMVPTVHGPKMGLTVAVNIGDVAFRPVVQDPEGAAFDRQIRSIETNAEIDGFLDKRNEMLRKIGELPTDEG